MKVKSFFKLLNRKINKYDKATSNPFEAPPLPIVIVWIDEPKEKEGQNNNSFKT